MPKDSSITHTDQALTPIADGEYPAPLSFDPEEYEQDLQDCDFTPEQQAAVLKALWQIMGAFVDMGFGVDSLQFALPKIFEKLAEDSRDMLEQKDNT